MAKERITRRLKVYTTRIGIHDWAVAVPSQKAALQAWDVRENLFATGAAKVVDDPAVVEAALKTPGVPVAVRGKVQIPAETKSNVVRLEDRRAQRPAGEPKKSAPVAERRVEAKRPERKPAPPPPDRTRLDAAEDELREFEIEIKVRRKELTRRKQELERETEAFETDAETRRRRLERQVEKAREAYDRAKNG